MTDRADVSWALSDVEGWLGLKMHTGEYSSAFAKELAVHMVERCYNVHAVYDELSVLEGTSVRGTPTRPASEFKRAPLKGLWHKHHAQAYFIVQNIVNHWSSDRRHSQLSQNVLDDGGSLDHLTDHLIVGAYEERARHQALTGEWIIFAKAGSRNFYLTLACHAENDATIFERARENGREFIELAHLWSERLRNEAGATKPKGDSTTIPSLPQEEPS